MFGLDPKEAINFVQDRPFNDQRYFLDDQKLKKLGWEEKTHWQEGLKRTMQWYTKNPNWWGLLLLIHTLKCLLYIQILMIHGFFNMGIEG